jgi:hypothetical protein
MELIPPPPAHLVGRPAARPTIGQTLPVGVRPPPIATVDRTAVGDTTPTATVNIEVWVDPIVDERGHDPRSAYVERYWLAVIGPTALWIMRRFADQFDEHPSGFRTDLDHTAVTMGLSFEKRSASPFGRALHRCVMFGIAQPIADGYAVRRRLPSVARRHLSRLPVDVQAEHDEWARRTVQINHGEIERRLRELGVSPAAAARACEAAALAS